MYVHQLWILIFFEFFFFSSRRRHTRCSRDWSSDVCSSDLAQPVMERLPVIPEQKALLSMDGGVCPDDGTPLAFDPWSPREHRCPRCGKTWSGERHDLHWVRFQHLWLAERAAHLSALAGIGDDAHPPAGTR